MPPEAEFPEGFYDDPFGGTWKRYWDGGRWLGKPDDSPDTAAEVVRGSAPPPTGEGYVPPRAAVDPQTEQVFDVPAGLYSDPFGGMWKRQWNGLSWEAKPTDGPENLQAIRSRRVPPPSLDGAEMPSTVRASDGIGSSAGDATSLDVKEIPAGYYVDPFGQVGRRYWTGTKWVGKKGDGPTETQAVLTGTAPLPSGNGTRTNVATGHVQPRIAAHPPNEAGLQWPSEDPPTADQTSPATPRSGVLSGLSGTTWVIIGVAVAVVLLLSVVASSQSRDQQTPVSTQEQEWIRLWENSSDAFRNAQCNQWNADSETYLRIGVTALDQPTALVRRMMDRYC